MRGPWRTGMPVREDRALAVEAVISECVLNFGEMARLNRSFVRRPSAPQMRRAQL
jgi:hypothetical protein